MNTLYSNSRNCCKICSCYYTTWSPGFSTYLQWNHENWMLRKGSKAWCKGKWMVNAQLNKLGHETPLEPSKNLVLITKILRVVHRVRQHWRRAPSCPYKPPHEPNTCGFQWRHLWIPIQPWICLSGHEYTSRVRRYEQNREGRLGPFYHVYDVMPI